MSRKMDCQILHMQKFFKTYAACFSKPTKIDNIFQDREQGSFNSVCLFFFFYVMSPSFPMSFEEPKINHWVIWYILGCFIEDCFCTSKELLDCQKWSINRIGLIYLPSWFLSSEQKFSGTKNIKVKISSAFIWRCYQHDLY